MRAKHKTPQEWEAIVSGQEQSGLTNKEYAELVGVSLSSFMEWKQRFKKVSTAPKAPLVEVSLPVHQGTMSLRFPNGLELQFPMSLGTTQILTLLNWAVSK